MSATAWLLRGRVRNSVTIGVIVFAIFAFADPRSWADDDKYDATKLVGTFGYGNMPLDQALKASEREGQPLSGKYEMDSGMLQLSVTAKNAEGFLTIIFDHKSGSIVRKVPMVDRAEISEAEAQNHAMSDAKIPLVKAIENAVGTNNGYQAVRVVPIMAAGIVPFAMVTLIRGTDIKDVFENLE
jgi:hypothetical protein